MRTVLFSPLYMAGVLAGAGLALFIVFIFSQVEGVTGVIGLLMLIAGGIWNLRLQSKNGK